MARAYACSSWAGDQVTDALAVARVQAACGARVQLTLGSEGVRAAEDALGLDAGRSADRRFAA